MKHTRPARGASLIEILVAAGIATTVMGAAGTLYVRGTTGFYQEQSQSYVQFRTRSVLERMATETRCARSFIPSVTIGSTTYTASDGSSSPACLIIQVPSQDANGLFYYGSLSTTPNALVTDTIVYWYQPSDKTLRRTVQASTNVATNDGSVRSSFRPSETNTIVAHDISGMQFNFKDRDGLPIGTNSKTRIASVDLQTTVTQISNAGNGLQQSTVAISGVRLRNMRSGSIPGTITRSGSPLSGALVQAKYTSTSGAYQAGTIVGSATTSSTGGFEIYGLEEGTYDVIVTPAGGTATTAKSGVVVPDENAADAVNANIS